MIGTRPRFVAVLTLSGALSVAPAAPQPPTAAAQREHASAEEITVFEAQVTVDPSRLGPIDRQRMRPDQILLLEGGVPRRVTNLEALGSGGWRILIYFDAPSSREKTVKLAAQKLGSLARRLTDLGAVEIVVADPEPKTVQESTHDATPVADRLARIASSPIGTDEIKSLRDAFEALGPTLAADDPRRAEALRRETELVRDRVDRLLLRAARGCESDPCALLLVSDGFYEDAGDFYLGEQRLTGPGEIDPIQRASLELAQTVTGYEWIVFPLPVREGRIDAPTVGKPRSDYDVFLDHTGAIRPAPKAKDREPVVNWEKLEVSVTPILQPLQRLAVASDGAVLRAADDVASPLDNLPSRRRVYYLTDRDLDGDPRTMEARMGQSGNLLAAAAYVRSSTPPAVAAARLRTLLAGRQLDGGTVPIQARLESGEQGQSTLVLEGKWEPGSVPPASLIRVSVGFSRAGDLPWVGHQRVRADALAADGRWQHRVALKLPPGAKLAVVAEALVPRTWGAATVVGHQP
jgi:hypothetical protein